MKFQERSRCIVPVQPLDGATKTPLDPLTER